MLKAKGELRLIGKNLKGKIEVRKKRKKIMFMYVRVVGLGGFGGGFKRDSFLSCECVCGECEATHIYYNTHIYFAFPFHS
jgi:hypothetical protein